ncbi:Phosphorylated carbohydrates phosphatase [Botrimarina colliarenosi]|uniref:Phosphorylated carbohydrates phosphatase n=1 Tax=Botrimarina colliarenosi TaxID=2528001 RepID=A0A5C6AA49_9BACT|nr:HAD family phosphatase [Botrimarina colliarenosi]TWT95911.1 Phosphorylated carbohydrates phosphatase [Botrimarina colliarenosi]
MSFPPPAKPIRAIAFDMDGVLASSEDVYLRVGTETLRRRGKPFEDALRHQMMGLPTMVALQRMIDWHRLDDSVEIIAAETEQTFWELAGADLAPMPGVAAMFDRLDAAGIPRGVVTSGARTYAERILTAVGVRDRLRFVITADDVRIGKPDPEPYLMAATEHGVDPAEMIVFEDSANGCRAGVAAGAYVVAVPSPHTHDHDFTGAAFVADTLADPRIAAVLGLV